MISAILLAAGQSKRMLGENKLIKKINGIPLINHTLQNILNSSIDEIIIVLGHEKEIVSKIINKNKKIKIIFNKNFKNGIATSIKIGLSCLSKKTEAFFICLADMPAVNYYNKILISYYSNLETEKKIKNSSDKKEIFVPCYKSIQTNPILFTISMKKNIMKIKGDVGAKNILKLNKDIILNINVDNLDSTKDFDTTNDFIS